MLDPVTFAFGAQRKDFKVDVNMIKISLVVSLAKKSTNLGLKEMWALVSDWHIQLRFLRLSGVIQVGLICNHMCYCRREAGWDLTTRRGDCNVKKDQREIWRCWPWSDTATSPVVLSATRSWKNRETDSPLELLEGSIPLLRPGF